MRNDDSGTPDLRVLSSRRRLEALERSQLLDAPPDAAFDRATRVATLHFGVPVALVSIVDDHRQYFKSIVGLPEPWATSRETPLTHSFCQYVVATDAPLVVDDSREHPLVQGNGAIEDLAVISYCGVPLHDGDGNVLGALCVIDGHPTQWTADDVALLSDLAEMLRTELRFREALGHAEQREAARSEMLAVLGHDLRGPLGAVTGLASTVLTKRDRLSEAQVEEILRAIERQSRQSGELVDRVLTIEGRPPTPVLEQLEVRLLVDTLVADRGIARPEHTVSVLDGDPVHAQLDALMLRQILGNLLDNAAKHAEGAPVTVGVDADGATVRVVVTDKGAGMAPDVLAGIFERHAGSRSMGSHGLGLHIVRLLVDVLGGDVEATSALGTGTSFIVTFPGAAVQGP